MHPDGTAADRHEGDRSGGDDAAAAASRPGPSTSPLLLVTEAAECSNTVRTSTCSSNSNSSSNSNNRSSRSTRTANGHLYSSLPLKNSPNKNCRLLKSGPFTPPPSTTPQALPPQIRRVLLHCNVNDRKRAAVAVASSSSCSSSSSSSSAVDESAADQQRRGRGRRQPPSSSFFGQESRRRQTKRSTTDQHVRRRLLLITSVISCASLLLFTLITSLIFIRRRPFDDVTRTDLNDELGGNDQQLIRKLRGAYSEMSPYSSENAQIWLLNTHEFRRQRRQQRHDTHGEANDQFLFGLARNCGQFCTVRLKHGVVGKSGGGGGGQLQHMESLRIRLERRRRQWTSGDHDDGSGARRRRSPNQQQNVDDFRPIVQTMEFDNQTMFRHSHVSPKCFYTARVAEHLEQSVVNLCDRNGGLFGTLALVEGAFVIEPLVDIEQEEEMVNGISGEQLQNVGVRKRKRHLTAEFASDLRAHLVYRLQPHHFEDDFHKRTATAAAATTEAEETKQGTEHHQKLKASTSTVDDQGVRSAKSVPPWPNRPPPLLTADADHENGTSVPHQRLLLQRSTRSANSWEHFVEVLVVADYKMLLYHQHNLENYVLTLFSTVSSIYRHSSLGAAINVIVVRLVVLKHERAGPDVSNRAQETLQQFCQWQHMLNDRNDDAVNHHDVAILLTRHDICRATNKCDTLGLAELGTMCDGRKSCAIIEDNGLSAAFTIAHELGHVFNIPHDDERKCAEFMPLNKHSYHIMAPTLEYNTNPWSWSSCSSAMLLRFLDHQRAQTQCLFDKPTERRYYEKMFETPAPGAVYTVSQQCKFVFGAAAEICPYMPTCRRLWCSVSYGYQMGCRTQHMPWADATPCGDNMWCHRGQCVGMSPMQRQPVDGGWGEWRPWRECSRTCGGGVQKAFRDCDSPRPENGGKYCVGQRERYRPCNVQDCPWDMPGFRELQCTEFDGTDIGIHGVPKEMKWVPKYTGVADNERCRLYCRGTDSAAFYLLKDKVADGTPCDRNGDDICIDGTCHKAGCDHRLGSEMKRDVCGVCGGNGSSCRAVNGLYNERSTFGYNEVLRIPAGAAGIDITQTAHNGQKEDDNYLALRTFTGEFLLNGQYQVSVFRQQIPILDTVLEYSGSDQAVERINGTGPLRSDIYLHVLSVGNLNKPNIRYHFMTPIAAGAAAASAAATAAATATGASNFYWRTESNWTECTLKCQGVQGQHVRCADSFTNRPVAEAHCAGIQRPDMQKRACNVDCFHKYLQRLNTDSAGRKWYQYICVRSYTNGKEEQALESECQATGLKAPVPSAGGSANVAAGGANAQHHHQSPPAAPAPAPSTEHRQHQQQQAQQQQQQQKLMAYSPSQNRWTAQWAYSQWSQCSETCGSGGLSRRSLHCIDTRNGNKLDARFCEGVPHEPVETECNRTPCPRWVYSQWYQCSRSCGGGLRMRHASCQDAAGRELNARMCTGEAKMDSQKCNEQACTQWRFGPWSPCSVSCGDGVQRREGVCVRATDAQPVEESGCEPRERILEKQCQRAACPHWKLGSWSQCSVSCGQDGFQTRLVQCVDSVERKLADQQCHGKEQKQAEKPQSYKVCSPGRCPYWRAAEWGQCSVPCGQGFRTRHVECVLKGQIVDDSLCMEAMRPKTNDRCVLLACAIWNAEPWSPCSTSCGFGIQKRAVTCVRKPTTAASSTSISSSNTMRNAQPSKSIVVHDRECNGQKPRTERSCEHLVECPQSPLNVVSKLQQQQQQQQQPQPLAKVRWVAGPWSDCSQSCGTDGVQRRTVECRDTHRELPSAYCAQLERPVQSQPCATALGLPRCAQWSAGDWSPCPPPPPPPQQLDACASTTSNNNNINDINIIMKAFVVPVPNRTDVSAAADAVVVEQRRRVFCQFFNGTEATDAAAHCGAPAARPHDRRPCPINNNKQLRCPRWHKEPWGMCSTSCGAGVARRDVLCRVGRAGGAQFVPDLECLALKPKPFETRKCELAKCPTYHWRVGTWSKCVDACKPSAQRRRVYCMSNAGKRAATRMCSTNETAGGVLLQPVEQRKCATDKCPYHWVAGAWSTCSRTCGIGYKFRRIECKVRRAVWLHQRQSNVVPVPSTVAASALASADGGNNNNSSSSSGDGMDSEPTVLSRMCMALEKPMVSAQCEMNPCSAEYHWSVGAWSQCSKNCGPGFRRRKVRCLAARNNSVRADKGKCTEQNRPRRREPCFVRNCLPSDCAELREQNAHTTGMMDGNYTVLVAGFRVTVYCRMLNESIPKTYLNVLAATNFAEFYGKRLANPYTCPYDGARNNSCACTNDGHVQAGLSRFSKVRVDLQNMKINPNDHTFALTEYGNRVAYGTAGDCYSASNECPQGHFSIDLRGTGIRLVDDLQWTSKGHRTSIRIDRSENNAVVKGFCGGYCGECAPDRFKGLIVEVDQRQKPLVGLG